MLKRLLQAYANCKFYKKLLITNVIIGSLPLCICGFLSYQSANHSLEQQIRLSIDDACEKTVYLYEDRMKKYNDMMDSITFSPEFIEKNEQYAMGLVDKAEWEAYIIQLNTFARILLPEISHIETSYDKVSREEYTLFSEQYRDAKNLVTQWTFINDELYLVRPVVNLETRKFLTFFIMQIDTERFWEGGEINHGQTSLQIYAPDRTLLYAQWGFKRHSNNIPVDMLYTQQPTINFQGVQYIVKHSAIPSTKWDLFYLVPYSVITDQTHKIINLVLKTICACFVATFILSFLTARLLSRRLQLVSDEMRRWENELPSSFDLPQGNDEIGQLSNVFSQLLMERESLLHDIYQEQLINHELEFKALQSQINPHFLYNCLENINWRALMLGDSQISEVVTDLADFYRLSVNKGKNVITLRDEIRNAQAYLNLQLRLHNNDFEIQYNIDQNLLDYRCIPLILQPIIENALEHGLDRQTEGNRFLRLSLHRDVKDLVITIVNSGPPIQGDTEAILDFARTNGYGLSNVQKRIQLRFGSSYGITIRAVNGLTECTVRLPHQGKNTVQE